MRQENLTEHALRGIRKALRAHSERIETRERQRLRAAERASRPHRPPRDREWWEEEAPEGLPRPALTPTPRVPAAETATGTVIEVLRGRYLVASEARQLVAVPGGRAGTASLVTGDRVLLAGGADGPARIVEALPRRSALLRAVGDGARLGRMQQQALAANVDQAVIVCSPASPPFRPGLIDRYLVAASRDGLAPLICLNKSDLGLSEGVEEALAGFKGLGVPVVRTSAVTGQGTTELLDALAGTTSVFTGHSGVGKSSLLNALLPGLGLRVGGVTEAAAGQGKGRHTTTSARLVPLPQPDTFIVDTPGIRVLGIQGILRTDLAGYFPDLAAFAAGCHYRGCLHTGEAACRVEQAAANDAWLGRRLRSYRRLLEE